MDYHSQVKERVNPIYYGDPFTFLVSVIMMLTFLVLMGTL